MSSERDLMLFELEQRLAQVGGKLSGDEAATLIGEEFFEFGASGRVWSKPEILAAMAQWKPIEREVVDFAVRDLAPFVCLVTYKSLDSNRQPSPFSLRSSIWRCTGDAWQIIFHQGTKGSDALVA